MVSSLVMEKAVATHSSTLAWKIPWAEEPSRLQSMGLRRVDSLEKTQTLGGIGGRRRRGPHEPHPRLSDFTFTFHFQALEKEMATHSSVLAWRIPGMGELGGLPSMGSHRVRHD